MTAGHAAGRTWAVGVAAAVLTAGLAVVPAPAGAGQPDVAEQPDIALAPPPAPVVEVAPPPTWPPAPTPDAAAWVLVEAATGQVLAGAGVDDRRPVASTVKVLTALSVVRRVDLDDVVVVGDEVVDVGGATVELAPGDEWTIEQLLDGLLARSGNDAAEALAAHVAGDTPSFVARMADDARALGLEGVVLTSPSGLDDGNQLSARDLATIARAALADPELRPLLARPTVELPGLGELESRNELLTTYDGATGLKTGFTLVAGNSLVASARRGDRELMAVVLGAGDDPARFAAAADLLDHGFDRLAPTTLDATLDLAVAGGKVRIVVPPVTVTQPHDRPVELALDVPPRPPEAALEVALVDGTVRLGTTTADLDTSRVPPDVDGGAALGRALVDGAYAALRAATATGVVS